MKQIICKIIGHRMKYTITEKGHRWGDPNGEPVVSFKCVDCGFKEDVEMKWRSTGKYENEGWESAVGSVRGKISLPEGNLFSKYGLCQVIGKQLAEIIKPKGKIIHDPTKQN